MKQYIMTALFMLLSLGIQGQQQYTIKGLIKSSDEKAPLEFANIVLQTSDSVFITGTNSNEKGIFRLEKVKKGDYRLIISSLGYENMSIAVQQLSRDTDLGTIVLQSSSISLNEVTVKASAVRSYSDRRIAFPTEQQKKSATNGINLLSSMMLPRLQINPILNTVTTSDDGTIQFCINGIKVEQTDVQALAPKDIIRVEYHDNPGVRYGNVSAVIDYIVKRETIGGSVNLNLSNSPIVAFGDDQVAIRLNHKKSEFGLQYYARYRDAKLMKEGTETYHFQNGNTLQRILEGLPAYSSETNHLASLNYSLVEADKYYFNAMLRYSFTDENKNAHNKLYPTDRPDRITESMNARKSTTHLPSLDLYYMRSLKNKQTFIANVVGTYIKSGSNQYYRETDTDILLSDILSDVAGKKYSLIGEGIYEKVWTAGRLSGGLRHQQAWTNNDYTGTVGGQTEMKQSETYLFTEFSGKVKKFSYTGGVGVSRSWFRQEGEEEYQYYSFRPKVTLQYNFTDNMFLRLGGSIDNTSPSLSELSDIEQYIDTLQIRRGNPALTPYINYNTFMNYEYKKGIFTGGLNFYYRNSPDMIMEETLRENGKFIRTYANQTGWQKLSSDINVRLSLFKNIVMLSATGGVNHFISDGQNYHHTYTNLYYNLAAMAMYKKFMAMFQIGSRRDNFVGETLHGGENVHLFMLRYNQGKFTAGAGIMLPFSSEYRREDENRNQYAPSRYWGYSNDFSRMLILTFSWNFDFGRKFRSGNKKINNSDSDTGIIKGDK